VSPGTASAGSVNSSRRANFVAARLGVEPLGIAALAGREIGREIRLDEPVRADDPPCRRAILPIRRNERRDDDEPRFVHQTRDLGHAPDVFPTILGRKPEVAVEPMPQVVPVEHEAGAARIDQAALELAGNRRFSGTGESR